MLGKVESKGYISVPKYGPNILKRFINFLIKLGQNKELLNYWKGYSLAELKFYVFILLFVLCVFSYFSYIEVSSNIDKSMLFIGVGGFNYNYLLRPNKSNIIRQISNSNDKFIMLSSEGESEKINMDDYGNIIRISPNNIEYALSNNLKKSEFIRVESFINEDGNKVNNVSVYDEKLIDKNNNNIGNFIIKWTDTQNNFGFVRNFGKVEYYYKDLGRNKIILDHIEGLYNYPNLVRNELDIEYDDKIGTIDFETYGDNDTGLGVQNVYAGGWCTQKHEEIMYIDKDEVKESILTASELLVQRIIKSIFDNIDIKDKYTFYAHNLGRFDSLFILDILSKM